MPCETVTNEDGSLKAIICTAPWGLGVYEVEGYGPVYGMGGSGDPHDFEPDEECNTPEEIAAWEAAKEACKCGRQLFTQAGETP